MSNFKVGDIVKITTTGWGFAQNAVDEGCLYLVSKVYEKSHYIEVTDLGGNQAYVADLKIKKVIEFSFSVITLEEQLEYIEKLIKRKEENGTVESG